jgi:hypothetical protein
MTNQDSEGRTDARPLSAEDRISDFGIRLPDPPTPFGSYVEAVQREAYSTSVECCPWSITNQRTLAHSAWNSTQMLDEMRPALQPWAHSPQPGITWEPSIEIKRVVRFGVFMVASGNGVDQPAVANGASDFFEMYSARKTWLFAR